MMVHSDISSAGCKRTQHALRRMRRSRTPDVAVEPVRGLQSPGHDTLAALLLAQSIIPVKGGQRLLALPFDALRYQYASAVSAGMAPRSIVESGKWERRLDALEKLTLGPWARHR